MTTLLALFAFFTIPSFAETPACHSLDFDSYFVAQQAKSNLQKMNDLQRPNFARNFLLVKNAMMMETLYLIADCRTGKFLHEKISGEAKFTLESNEVLLSNLKTQKIEKMIWNGERFLKAEDPPGKDPLLENSADSIKTSAVRAPLMTRYDELFVKYPAKEMQGECKSLNYESFFEAQKAKSQILKSKVDLSKPNFGGAYLLLKSEALFDVQQLLAYCQSGNFLHLTLNGSAVFRKDSRLVRLEHSGDFPDFYLFDGDDWLQIPDPVQNHKQKIKNSLSAKSSDLLYRSLPNPKHLSILRFENLEASKQTSAIFESLGVQTIKAGKCSAENQSPRCEVETE